MGSGATQEPGTPQGSRHEPVEVIRLADVPTHSAGWHAARRGGIGSSDAPAVAGIDRWGSPFSVWVAKTADVGAGDETAVMRWGTRLEAVVADAYADEHPEWQVMVPPAMYAHPQWNYLRASPDRFLVDPATGQLRGVLECKTSSLPDEWDVPPDRVIVQVQHQLAVMGLEVGAVAVLLNGRDFRSFQVPRDDALIEQLLRIEHAFWRRVVDGTPPPIDGHESTTDALRALYPSSEARAVELPVEALELVQLREQAKAQLAKAKATLDEVENQLKGWLGDAAEGTVNGDVVVRWKTSNEVDQDALAAAHPGIAGEFDRRHLDLDALRKAHPALVKEFTQATGSRRLTFPKPKEG